MYLNLVHVAMTLLATHYTTPDSERASLEDSEYTVLVNGTQKFASLDFKEVCYISSIFFYEIKDLRTQKEATCTKIDNQGGLVAMTIFIIRPFLCT